MECLSKISLSKRNSIKSFLVFIAIFAITFLMVNCNTKPSEDLRLKAMVEKINKGCPIQIDPYTSLTSVKLLPSKTILYNYTLPEITKEGIDLEKIKEQVFPALLQKFRENPEVKPLRDLNATLKHHYVDKNDELIIEYVITPGMYNKKVNEKLYDKKNSL